MAKVVQLRRDRSWKVAARLLLLVSLVIFCAFNRLDAQPAAAVPINPEFKDRPAYRIGPGDVVQITVWNEPQVSQASVMVLPDGKINMPLVGEVGVAGFTLKEVESRLGTLFKPFITDPDVSVIVRESNSQKIFVVGAVRKEGPIKLVTPLTVLQAIAEAGGLTDFAHKKAIYVLRTEGTRQLSIPFDYSAVIRGQKPEQNVVLQSGDTIVVPH